MAPDLVCLMAGCTRKVTLLRPFVTFGALVYNWKLEQNITFPSQLILFIERLEHWLTPQNTLFLMWRQMG